MNKIKVVIVDDEYLIRELLQNKIDWDKLNCEIVLKASCAAQVYDYLEEEEVDLILTDINMPFVDGLEMARRISKEFPKIKFIVITGFNDFEYAKKGIDIGVEGFILKPIDQSEVEPVIEKAIKLIRKDLKREVEYKRLIQRVEDERPFLKEKIFFDMIERSILDENMIEKAARYGINNKSTSYQVGLIKVLGDDSNIDLLLQQCRILLEDYFDTLANKEDHKTLEKDALKLIDGNISDEIDGENTHGASLLDVAIIKDVHVFVNANNYFYLLNTSEKIDLADELKYCSRMIRESLNLEIIIGLSRTKEKLKNLAEAASEAKICLKYCEDKNSGNSLSYDEIDILNEEEMDFSKEVFYINDLLESLQFYLKAGLENEVSDIIDQLFHSYAKFVVYKNYAGDAFLKVQLTRVISTVQYTIISLGSGIYEELLQDSKYIELSDSQKLYTIDSMATGKEWIKEFCGMTLEHINNKLHKKNKNVIDSINHYINENLSDSSLTLKGTAEKFYINSSYLSRTYKKEVGESFKERVFKLRMEKAVDILKTTDMKVYEVGIQVGIDDPNYFSLCFKKFMNMSISEFRKKINSSMK